MSEMEGGHKSQGLATADQADLTSGHDVEDQLQADFLAKFSEIEKALTEVAARRALLFPLRQAVLKERKKLDDTIASIKIAIAKRPHRSLPMEAEQARSVFFMVSFSQGKYSGALYEVKLNQKGEYMGGGGGGGAAHEPPLLEPVQNFTRGHCIVRGARISSVAKLYLLPGKYSGCKNLKTLEGFIFDPRSRSFDPLKPPKAPRPFGIVVSAYGKLYYFASPKSCRRFPKLFFEMYDPSNDQWNTIPCSYPFLDKEWANFDIIGYVVCYGYILFSMCEIYKSNYQVMAFDVSRRKWHDVEVPYGFVAFWGRGVVVGKTIYALAKKKKIVAFSFNKVKVRDQEGRIGLSLITPSILPGLDIVDWPFEYRLTEYLVHLGNQDFCHLCTCKERNDRQHVCITMFQIVVGEGGSHIKTLNTIVCAVEVKDNIYFSLGFSFSPECEDFEPEEEERMTAMKEKAKKTVQKKVTMGKSKEKSCDHKATIQKCPVIPRQRMAKQQGKPNQVKI